MIALDFADGPPTLGEIEDAIASWRARADLHRRHGEKEWAVYCSLRVLELRGYLLKRRQQLGLGLTQNSGCGSPHRKDAPDHQEQVRRRRGMSCRKTRKGGYSSMTPDDSDKRLRTKIERAFVPADLCATDPDAIEALLDAAKAEPFPEDKVNRMLGKLKGDAC